MNIEDIKACVRNDQYGYSMHAEIECKADELTFAQVEEALLDGQILEQYPDTGRGEKIVLITVYVPKPPKFVDPRTRGETNDEETSEENAV
jgi:hypothetical protein